MKRIIAIASMCFVSFCVNAQEIIRNNYNSIITADNTSSFTGNNKEIRESSPYFKGSYFENVTVPDGGKSSTLWTGYFELGKQKYVAPQVPLYFGLGLKMLYDYDTIDTGYKSITTSYSSFNLRVPLNIGYNIMEQDRLGLTLRTGPYLDWVIYGYNEIDDEKTDLSDIDGYKTLIAGWNIGADLHFGRIAIFGEYGWGITERNKYVKENYWCIGILRSF